MKGQNSKMSEFLTLDAFEEASEKVKEAAVDTKLIYSDFFSTQYGNGTNKVYLKPENMQVTGAYKVRGAYYRISTLSEEERKKGVVTMHRESPMRRGNTGSGRS